MYAYVLEGFGLPGTLRWRNCWPRTSGEITTKLSRPRPQAEGRLERLVIRSGAQSRRLRINREGPFGAAEEPNLASFGA
jgi:hypothetical protein